MGYVLLAHEDGDVVKRDFDYICSLQTTMIDIEDDDDDSNSTTTTTTNTNTGVTTTSTTTTTANMIINSNDNTNQFNKILSLININILKNIIINISSILKNKLVTMMMITLSSFIIGLSIMIVLPLIYK